MADIALRTYYRQIDQLIDQKHLEEALAYCKNILHRFPKDLEAYRLMGKALLERGRHGDAADVFQRVLSALPDDFISHVGMAIVREDEGNLEAALWHMERAFEASPSNPAVQDELRRLYGRRDGIVPHRAQLTRGALARLYYKQGLYAQAETELRSGLAEQPDRPDLVTLLVQVLWENGHRAEAAELGQGLLQRLPYNLEVNRVMAQAAASQNQTTEARECRQRLEELDPYEAFTSDSVSAASVQADALRISEIAWAPELSDSQKPDWSNALGADLGSKTEDVLPDWVRSGTALLVDENDVDAPRSGPTPDLPDWMRATTGILGAMPAGHDTHAAPIEHAVEPDAPIELEPEPSSPFEPAAAPTEDFLPDWLADVTAPKNAEAGSEPDQDWLTALSTPVDAAPAPAAPMTTTEAPIDLPDWLTGVDAVDTPTNSDWHQLDVTSDPALNEPPLSAAALGAAGAGALSGTPDSTPSPASGSFDDLPDWLQSAASTGDGDVPDWLASTPAAAADAALSEPASDVPAWLPGDSSEATGDSVLADDTPDWLRGATGQTGMLGGAPVDVPQPKPADLEAAPTEPDDVEDAGEIPAWLKAAQPIDEAPTQAPELSVPDWLSAASSDTGDLGELPDWLKATETSVQNVTLPAATVEEPPIQEATVDVRAVDPSLAPPAQGIDLPDWLTTTTDSRTGETTGAGSFDDDAFAWLEGLAARQGADPAELSAPQAEPTAEQPSSDESGPDTSVPDWLTITPDSELPATPETTVGALTEGATDDDTFAWLETLAARQDADPAELNQPASEVELPDFLQPASPEAIERANQPVDWSVEDEAAVTENVPALEDAPDSAAMPEWIKALAPGDDEPIGKPLEQLPEVDAAELPDWLRPSAEFTPPATPEAATLSAPVEEETPEPPPLSDDAAFAWLEGLAAANGADPATLNTPADAGASANEVLPETTAPLADEDAYAWLESLAAAQGADPATLSTPVDAGASANEVLPETTAPLADDDAFAWLESLAAAQGADPATLTTAASAQVDAIDDRAGAVIAPHDSAPAELAETSNDLPEWLKSAVEPESGPAAELNVAAPEATTPGGSDDEAFAWLESLAARQGADPATLTTNDEQALEGAAVQADAEPAIDIPDWLAAATADVPTEEPDASSSSDRTVTRPLAEPPQEAPRPVSAAWLREPIEPSAESSDRQEITLPDWLQSEIGVPAVTAALIPADIPPVAEPVAMDAPVDEPAVRLEPQASQQLESAPEGETPAGPPITTGDKRTALLAGKLADRKRAREAEVQDRFDRQRAAREIAQREIEQKMANRRAGLAPEPMPSPSEMPTAPLPEIDAVAETSVAHAPEALPFVSQTEAARPRWRPRPAAFADLAPDELLSRSRAQLAGGQEAAAMAMYTQLIKSGHHLDVVLADLQAHIARGRATALAYRALGDAQMKSGDLQTALASYRAALERA